MISTSNIYANYGEHDVLKSISMSINDSEIFGIIGPNGCGKSTLLKCIARQKKLNRGSISLDGKSIENYTPKEYAKKVSFLVQSRDVVPMSVSSLVLHGRFPYMSFPRHTTDQDRKIVEQALKQVGIFELRNKSLTELSGGERQKAYIAMALCQDSDILLLDEPATYLDIRHQLELYSLIKELKSGGKTVVTVLHDINTALSLCDAICLLDVGAVAFIGKPNELVKTSAIEQVFGVKTMYSEVDGKICCNFVL